ncbi:MAG TPA: hypothetical protein VMV27_04530 [Candidatus Binataceae bacterium]|nr:hypothetical protein [Candidatus Binataceae bacterium]
MDTLRHHVAMRERLAIARREHYPARIEVRREAIARKAPMPERRRAR